MADRSVAESAPALVVRGGTVVDGSGATAPKRADVAVTDGVVVAVGPDLDVPRGALELDAGGCVVAPGLVDLHAHLRQPGFEEAETVASAARAAALGGYTALVAMPNTDPPVDSAGTAREILELGRGAAAEVAVAGTITVGRLGVRLAPLAELAELGVRLFTDDGAGVQDGALMRRALEYARGLRVTLAEHCEDRALNSEGVMHEGEWSSRLGLPGSPAAAEEAMVARDLALVRAVGTEMHFLHLSTAASVDLVRRAKAEGLPVTAEVAPHHLSLTHAEVAGYDPVFRVSPPLRTPADVEALRDALRDGTVDAVATDHAPHTPESKELPFDEAPPGMIGLETSLAVAFTELCANGRDDASGRRTARARERKAGDGEFGVASLLGRFCAGPAAIAGLGSSDLRPAGHSAHGGPICEGTDANLCVFDPQCSWVVDAERLASRSRNTPFAGRRLSGRVRHTVLRGEAVVIDSECQR